MWQRYAQALVRTREYQLIYLCFSASSAWKSLIVGLSVRGFNRILVFDRVWTISLMYIEIIPQNALFFSEWTRSNKYYDQASTSETECSLQCVVCEGWLTLTVPYWMHIQICIMRIFCIAQWDQITVTSIQYAPTLSILVWCWCIMCR